MKYDADKLTQLISELKNALTLLDELANMTFPDFLSDPHKVASAKYNFIVAIESIIDICNHLISRNGYRIPEDYADTFRVFAENKLLPQEFAATLIKMAKFRNRLVHLYWKIDLDVLFAILQNNLGDFNLFLKQLNKLIKIKY